MKRFVIVTSCMGRLSHLKLCAEKLMVDPRIGQDWGWVLVDYGCPEDSGKWLDDAYQDRVEVIRVEPKEVKGFDKPLALNTGAMQAIGLGAEYLVFMDADTLVTPGLLDYIESLASLDSFLIFEPVKRDLTGFLVVSHRHFLASGGFDPLFKGWGAEDLEFRLKLHFRQNLKFYEMPAELADSISHDDEARVANYAEKDKDLSHLENLNRLCANVVHWTGKHLVTHYENLERGATIRRLLGTEALSPAQMLFAKRKP